METIPHAEASNQETAEVSAESIEAVQRLRSYLGQGYLLHGSKNSVESLEPRQARDTDETRTIGHQFAVYATHHLEIPIFMALKDKKDPSIRSWRSGYSGKGDGTWHMWGEDTALTPGYVYVLPPDTFESIKDERGGEELVSRVPVTPIDILKIEPDILGLFPNISLELK